MMIKLDVFKNIYYNTKSAERDLELKAPVQIRYLGQKKNVDINELLNRVKIEKKNETQKKTIFFSSVVLTLVLIGTFLATIK